MMIPAGSDDISASLEVEVRKACLNHARESGNQYRGKKYLHEPFGNITFVPFTCGFMKISNEMLWQYAHKIQTRA